MPFEHLFFGLFAAFGVYAIYGVIKNKGFRGAMFGSPVLQTLGEVQGVKQGLVSVKLKIHVLEGRGDPEKRIGLELVAKSFASWQMMPITLSRSEAKALHSLLQQAISAE